MSVPPWENPFMWLFEVARDRLIQFSEVLLAFYNVQSSEFELRPAKPGIIIRSSRVGHGG